MENNDNPPVRVEAVHTEQENKEFIAYLEKGENFQLIFDDLHGIAPVYDLKQFRNVIPKSVHRLKTGDIKAISHTANTQTKKNINWWIWPTILVVIILLSYLTWSLTRDMKKSG